MRGWNVKVELHNTVHEDIVRLLVLGEKNENNGRSQNLCAFNKMVIVGVIFPHKRMQKATWSHRITLKKTRSIIFAWEKFRKYMVDVGSRRGSLPGGL